MPNCTHLKGHRPQATVAWAMLGPCALRTMRRARETYSHIFERCPESRAISTTRCRSRAIPRRRFRISGGQYWQMPVACQWRQTPHRAPTTAENVTKYGKRAHPQLTLRPAVLAVEGRPSMMNFRKLAALGAVLAASASFAFADTITLGSFASGTTAASLGFSSSQTAMN